VRVQVRVLLNLRAAIGFNLQFVVVKPPLALLPPPAGSNPGGVDPFIQWAFNTANVSCVLWPAPASPIRRFYFRQTVPVMGFGYSVVTTRPQFVLPTTVQRVFTWTLPFSPGVWCLLATAILVYAIAMPIFEGRDSEQFGPYWDKKSVLVGHTVFLGAMGPSSPDIYEPTSGAGRAAGALHAFALLLIMRCGPLQTIARRQTDPRPRLLSTYVANLAAQLTTSNPAVQVVQDITSFNPVVTACSRSSSSMVTLLSASFPSAAAALSVNNTFATAPSGSRDAFSAVLAGNCAGAIAPQTEAAWILGVNDTAGQFCGLQVVGSTIGTESLPTTFSKASMTDSQMEALNMNIEMLQRAGTLMPILDAYFPSVPRPVCAAQDAADASAAVALLPGAQVEIIDLAGAFMLQAIGLSLAIFIHCYKLVNYKIKAARIGKIGGSTEETHAHHMPKRFRRRELKEEKPTEKATEKPHEEVLEIPLRRPSGFAAWI